MEGKAGKGKGCGKWGSQDTGADMHFQTSAGVTIMHVFKRIVQ